MRNFAYIALAILLMSLGDDLGLDPYGYLDWQFWLGLLVWAGGLTMVLRHGFRQGYDAATRGGGE